MDTSATYLSQPPRRLIAQANLGDRCCSLLMQQMIFPIFVCAIIAPELPWKVLVTVRRLNNLGRRVNWLLTTK